MKERPILFNGDMVRAILAGQKTQTRRVLKVQPPSDSHKMLTCISTTGEKRKEGKYHWAILGGADGLNIESDQDIFFSSPYGVPGDLLYVKETFFYEWLSEDAPDDMSGCNIIYRDDEPNYITDGKEMLGDEPWLKWQPSLFMPRWASRITLEIVDVRVERVPDISKADAIAEGVSGREEFWQLWDKINAKKGASVWDAPWVWVIEFKLIDVKKQK
jgi:hypothetical protein